MAHQWREDEAIPLRVRRPLGEWVDAVAAELRDDCLSIVLTGPLTRGDDGYAHITPVDLVVVLTDVDMERLEKLAEATQAVGRKLEVDPLVLSKSDLERSTDVFPTRFLSIQQHHLLLHGTDLLTKLPIARDHLRLRCEQELKALGQELRSLYLHRAHQLQGLIGTISEANVRFGLEYYDAADSTKLGETLVTLDLNSPNFIMTGTAIAAAAADRLGFDLEVVQTWLAGARGDAPPERTQARELVQRLMQAVRTAADAVDAMDQRDLI